jgi:hypothetical protein
MLMTLRTRLLLALLFLVAMSHYSVNAQEATSPSTELTVLRIRLTEYEINGPVDPELTNDALLEKLVASTKIQPDARNSATPFATVKNVYRFTNVLGVESSIQVGRTVGVTTGEVPNPRGGGAFRNITMREVGTLIKLVTSKVEGGPIQAKLTFETSDIAEAKPDVIAPEITQLSIESTIVLEKGKVALLLGTDKPKGTVITIAIE